MFQQCGDYDEFLSDVDEFDIEVNHRDLTHVSGSDSEGSRCPQAACCSLAALTPPRSPDNRHNRYDFRIITRPVHAQQARNRYVRLPSQSAWYLPIPTYQIPEPWTNCDFQSWAIDITVSAPVPTPTVVSEQQLNREPPVLTPAAAPADDNNQKRQYAAVAATPTFPSASTSQAQKGKSMSAWRASKAPVQCYNCQGFRHSYHVCHYPTRCVRCGERHKAADCRRPRSAQVCCNCGGPHAANFRRCRVYLREARSKRAGRLALTKPLRRGPETGASIKKPMVEESAPATLMAQANDPKPRGPTPHAPANSDLKRKAKKQAAASTVTTKAAPTAPSKGTADRTPTATKQQKMEKSSAQINL